MKPDPRLKRARFLRRVVGIVWDSAPGATVAKSAVIAAQGVLPIVSLYLLKLTIDAITAAARASDPDFTTVVLLIIAMGAAALAGAVAQALAAAVGEAQEQAITDHVVSRMHAKSIAVDLAHFENATYYDVLHRAQREASYRPMRIVNGLGQLAQNGVALTALLGLLLSLHWGVAVVLVAATLPGTILKVRSSRRLYRWQREVTPIERQGWYFHWLLTGEPFAKELRLFDFGTYFIQRYRDIRRVLRGQRLRLTVERSVSEVVGELCNLAAIFGALIYIAHQTTIHAITVGSLVMYFQAFQSGQAYLRDLLSSFAHLYEDALFVEDLFEFLDMEPAIVTPKAASPVPGQIGHGIEFENVGFCYGRGERPVLDGISLSIRRGEHVAFVGENGAGKTTLVKLLCRLYDPTAGRIALDGVDLRELDLDALRRRISAVFQDFARYDLTVRENIWLGNTRLDPLDARIADAAHAAGIEDMIGKLPQGYETRLGKWFENEQEMSLGQWQKIAVARAFVRDSQIVVLDEPTSALDPSAEHDTVRNFRKLAAGRTTVLISHRFSTVRLADRIFVLSNGRIAECGTHGELMRRGGEYARMFELQAENYR